MSGLEDVTLGGGSGDDADLDDVSLVRAAQAGDPAGLGALFVRHRARLYAVAVGLLGHGPDADDAVQDAMVIAIRKIGELREPAAVGGWLAAVVVNVCRGRLRRQPHELPDTLVVEQRGGLDDPVQEIIDRGALRDWVWTALEHLSEPQRVTVMLRHFSTTSSYAAIADICDVPVGTVRSRLHAARRQLVDELLATAEAAHLQSDETRGWSLAATSALLAFEGSGDPRLLESAFAPDVAFRMADRVERRGRAALAAGLARDFDDGVTVQPLRIIPGRQIAIIQLLLDNPSDKPLHCPPAVTQVHFHRAGRTHRLVSHYAARRS